jgi:hypothetical protein
VEGPAVDLDEEVVVAEREVAFPAVVVHVDLGPRKVMVGAELEERGLDVAARPPAVLVAELGDDAEQPAAPAASRVGGEGLAQRGEVEELALVGLLDRPPKVAARLQQLAPRRDPVQPRRFRILVTDPPHIGGSVTSVRNSPPNGRRDARART